MLTRGHPPPLPLCAIAEEGASELADARRHLPLAVEPARLPKFTAAGFCRIAKLQQGQILRIQGKVMMGRAE